MCTRWSWLFAVSHTQVRAMAVTPGPALDIKIWLMQAPGLVTERSEKKQGPKGFWDKGYWLLTGLGDHEHQLDESKSRVRWITTWVLLVLRFNLERIWTFLKGASDSVSPRNNTSTNQYFMLIPDIYHPLKLQPRPQDQQDISNFRSREHAKIGQREDEPTRNIEVKSMSSESR